MYGTQDGKLQQICLFLAFQSKYNHSLLSFGAALEGNSWLVESSAENGMRPSLIRKLSTYFEGKEMYVTSNFCRPEPRPTTCGLCLI